VRSPSPNRRLTPPADSGIEPPHGARILRLSSTVCSGSALPGWTPAEIKDRQHLTNGGVLVNCARGVGFAPTTGSMDCLFGANRVNLHPLHARSLEANIRLSRSWSTRLRCQDCRSPVCEKRPVSSPYRPRGSLKTDGGSCPRAVIPASEIKFSSGGGKRNIAVLHRPLAPVSPK
jgi:hypothetical protein